MLGVEHRSAGPLAEVLKRTTEPYGGWDFRCTHVGARQDLPHGVAARTRLGVSAGSTECYTQRGRTLSWSAGRSAEAEHRATPLSHRPLHLRLPAEPDLLPRAAARTRLGLGTDTQCECSAWETAQLVRQQACRSGQHSHWCTHDCSWHPLRGTCSTESLRAHGWAWARAAHSAVRSMGERSAGPLAAQFHARMDRGVWRTTQDPGVLGPPTQPGVIHHGEVGKPIRQGCYTTLPSKYALWDTAQHSASAWRTLHQSPSPLS